MKKKYTREDLIDICDKAVVPYNSWCNRDTPSAQAQTATARAYLLAGCDFKISTDGNLTTDENTVWVYIKHYEFEDTADWHSYYLPTEKSLKESEGRDWY